MVIRPATDLFEDLEPAEAARRFERDPSSVVFSLSEILRCFDVSEGQLHTDLCAGKIIAHGVPDGAGGYKAIHVRGDQLMRWMTLTGRQFKPRKVN